MSGRGAAHGHSHGHSHSHGHGHGHSHGHGVGPGADRRLLRIALALIVAFMIGEATAGFLAHSVALFADAAHMLADAAALMASLGVLRLVARPAAGSMTFGWNRAEVLSAAASAVTMLVVAGLVASESIRRLIHPPQVGGLTVLIVALVGIAVNLLATATLAKANRDSPNIEGAYQHVLTDLFSFVATAVAGAVVLATGFTRADPVAGIVVVVVLVRSSAGLLLDAARVLLEAAPRGVDLAAVRAELLSAEHVADVHDLHVWTLTTSLPSLSAHVVVDDSCFLDGHAPQILDQLQEALAGRYDVEHSTFQLEPASHSAHEAGAHA